MFWLTLRLPLDLDRNWTKVRQIDISYYTNFVKEHRSSSLMGLPQTENIHDRTLMENEAHQHIQLIQKGRPNNLQVPNTLNPPITRYFYNAFSY